MFWTGAGRTFTIWDVSLDIDGLRFVNYKSEGDHQKSHTQIRQETPGRLGPIDELVSDHPSRQLAKPCRRTR